MDYSKVSKKSTNLSPKFWEFMAKNYEFTGKADAKKQLRDPKDDADKFAMLEPADVQKLIVNGFKADLSIIVNRYAVGETKKMILNEFKKIAVKK